MELMWEEALDCTLMGGWKSHVLIEVRRSTCGGHGSASFLRKIKMGTMWEEGIWATWAVVCPSLTWLGGVGSPVATKGCRWEFWRSGAGTVTDGRVNPFSFSCCQGLVVSLSSVWKAPGTPISHPE